MSNSITIICEKFKNKQKLSDCDVNNSIKFLIEQYNNNGVKNIKVLDSLFYSDLTKLEAFIKKNRLHSFDVLIVPIYSHMEHHWSMCVVRRDKKNKKTDVYSYDTLRNTNLKKTIQVIKNLSDLNVVTDLDYICVPEYFEQTDGWSCGYFCILSAYLAISDLIEIDHDLTGDSGSVYLNNFINILKNFV